MTPEERQRLQALQQLGTFSRDQVEEYFKLLVKAAEEQVKAEVKVEPVVVEVKKKSKKKVK
jgi:hypothetical protein